MTKETQNERERVESLTRVVDYLMEVMNEVDLSKHELCDGLNIHSSRLQRVKKTIVGNPKN